MVPSKFGRYQILGEVGRGGMARVYRAMDPRFEREVAVKVLPSEVMDEAMFRARFEREAKVIAALEHPAIVTVYDFGDQEGQPYLVMRHMPGGSLRDRLSQGSLTPDQAVHLIRRMASALDYAHERGIIHRDLKPGNILFDGRGDPYLTDFGIVKMAQGGATLTGESIIGTPAYMSPEQAQGDTTIDHRTDIYSLGVILFEMLTGKQPYSADTPISLALKHIREPIPRLKDFGRHVPEGMQAVIDKAMAKSPVDRYGSAAQMARAVDSLGVGEASEVEETSVAEPFESVLAAAPEGIPPVGGSTGGETGLGATLQPLASPAGDTAAAAEHEAAPASAEPIAGMGGPERGWLRSIPTYAWIGGGAAAVAILGLGLYFAFAMRNANSPKPAASPVSPAVVATSPSEPQPAAWPEVSGAPPAENVAAFYYPWFGNPDLDGDWRMWQGAGRQPPDDLASDYYPLLGPYSSMDPAIVAQHFAWLREAGVGIVVAAWGGPGDPTDEAVPQILEAADHYGLRVAFQIEAYGERNAGTLVDHLRYLVDTYGGHPSIYKTPDATLWVANPEPRPLFFLADPHVQPGAAGQADVGYWNEALDAIHQSNLGVILAGNSDVVWVTEGHFDGLYNDIPPIPEGGQAFGWARQLPPGAWYVPSVIPGFSAKQVGSPVDTFLPRNNGGTYDSQWESALAQEVSPNLIAITSFNGWQEGTQIEPALSEGKPGGPDAYSDYGDLGPFGYLERTREWVDRLQGRQIGGPFECRDPMGCVTYGPNDPIKLASALVISGPNADLGTDSQRGVQIAIEFKGQVDGHDITLQAEDDGCNAEGGQVAGQKIVSDPTILGVIGTSCSGAGVPMSQLVSEAGYFMVSPSNTSPVLTDPNQAWNPGYLRTAHNDKVQGSAMADFVYHTLGLRTAAAIHDGDPYTEGLANAFRTAFESLGGKVVAFTAINVGDTDMHPVLSGVAAAGPPQFIYFPVFTSECAFLAKQSKEVAGLENTVVAAADGCISTAAAQAIGPAGEGMYFSGPDVSFTGDLNERFNAAYRADFGTDPISVFHAHAFDATNMIFACIEQVGVQDPDGALHIGRQAMRDCLYATKNFQGITGNLTCDQYGDCADPKISVSQLQKGKYVKIWP